MAGRKFALSLVPAAILVGAAVLTCAAQTAPQSGGTDKTKTNAEKVGPIAVTVTTDKKSYAVGAPIKLTLTARNTTREDVHLTFSSGQTFDFMIRRSVKSDAPVLWRWSHDKSFAQMLSGDTLLPGKRQTYHAVFDPQTAAKGSHAQAGKPVALAPGTYTVSGTLTVMSRSDLPTGAVTFQIK